MIVLTFQPRFAPLVKSGAKRQTIRLPRKRPIRVGDRLSLREWTGRPYMSPQRILVDDVPCTRISQIHIGVGEHRDEVMLGGQALDVILREKIAVSDGFDSWLAMRGWFSEQHGLPFTGVLIGWDI